MAVRCFEVIAALSGGVRNLALTSYHTPSFVFACTESYSTDYAVWCQGFKIPAPPKLWSSEDGYLFSEGTLKNMGVN